MAALLMAKLCADARFCMLTEPDLAAAITKLNSLISQSGIAAQFVTLIAIILDPATNLATLVHAGHPSPVIYHQATRTVTEAINNDAVGLPLGVVDGFKYISCQLSLDPGDSIVAFTDGVTEAMDPHDVQLQTSGLYAALLGKPRSPQALVEQVVKVVKEFSAGRTQHDDIAVVGFGRTAHDSRLSELDLSKTANGATDILLLADHSR